LPLDAIMETTCGIYLYSVPARKFLIGHATRSKNSWSIPKGLKDEGEDDLKAAIRELEEETGIVFGDLDVVGIHPLPPVQYKKQKKVLSSFLVITNTDLSEKKLVCHSLVNGKFPEIDKFMWADADTVRSMAHETQAHNMDLVEEILKREGF
jgi:8-oxo-dGTP pyrophosphatase MutT (NUDIX family)